MQLRLPVGVSIVAATFLSGTVLVAQQQASPIRGVWQVVEIQQTGPNKRTITNPQPGLYLFTDRHFSILRVNGDKPRPDIDGAAASAQQIRAVYDDGLFAQAGTYAIVGSILTTRPTVAKEPRIMAAGTFTEYSFTIRDTTLTLTNVRSQAGRAANPTTVKLVRLE